MRVATSVAVYCLGAWAVMSAGVAAAQVAAPPAAQAPSEDAPTTTASGQLTEVVVTAQRRSENLQKVPISVAAIPAATLQAAGITTSADLSNITPSVVFSESNGNLEPRIRGLGNSSAGAAVENSVATYVDGVYIASSPGSMQNLENIQRVEVLDGPQGTLFGRNATGGLVQIITKDPKSVFGGSADVSYESYDTTRLNLYLTGPVAEHLDADLAVYAAHQGDGYGTNLFNDRPTYKTDEDFSIRSKWLARLDSGTIIRMAFDFSDRASSDPGFSVAGPYQPGLGRLSTSTLNYLVDHPYDVDQNNSTRRKVETGGLSFRVDQPMGALNLTDITAFRRNSFSFSFDADGLPQQVVQQIAFQRDAEFTEELQLSPIHTDRLQWVAGLYYFHLGSEYAPYFATFVGAPPKQTSTLSQPIFTTDSIAGYAQATYELFTGTHVTGGIRYTDESRTEGGDITSISAAGVPSQAVIPHAAVTTNSPTWRLALDHQFGPDILGYISWNRGFKSGGFNPTLTSQPPYKPERLDDYEIGEKSTLFNGRVRLNAAFFYYVYKNIQVNSYVNSVAVIYNGAEAREYGLDATFDASITSNLMLTGGITALHTNFNDFPNAVISSLSAMTDTFSQHQGSATGNDLPYAPSATVSLGVDYHHEIAHGRGDLYINDLYDSGYYGQVDNVLHQSSFHKLNASLEYRPDGSPLTFRLFARNILNEHVAEFLSVSSTGATASWEAPTTYGFTVGVKF